MAICAASQLDLFCSPATQASQIKNAYVAHYPLTSLSDGPLEFDINPSTMYTDLSNTRLYLKVKMIDANGIGALAGTEVAPVNMLLHALFSKIDVHVGGQLITQSSDTYPWKAAFETLLNFGKEAKDTQLASIMFYKDKLVGQDDRGADKRYEIAKEAKQFELFGPLHVDLFFQDKYLLNQVPIRIVLHRNPPTFYLQASQDVTNPNFKIVIQEAILFIRRVAVAPQVELAHAKVLERKNAIYPLHRSEIEVIPLAGGMSNMLRDNLFGGKVPKKLVIAVLSNASYNGHYLDSPFHFRHHGLEEISLVVDGEPVAGTPLNLDFAKNLYMRAYDNLFNSLNKSYTNYGLDISYEEFKQQALFCFDLTADGCGNTTAHFEMSRGGNLRVKLRFSKPTTETLYILLYAEFEAVLEITKARQVLQQ